MPVPLRMPSERDLPPGPRRQLVEELFTLFRLARRPALSEISDHILNDPSLPGTASRETVRRVLTGKTVPATWATAFSVFKALCDMAGIDTGDPKWDDGYNGHTTYEEAFTSAWHEAIDRPQAGSAQRHASHEDPWGPVVTAANGSYDEPPF